MTPEDLAAVPAMIRGEVLKEERIQSCTVQATPLVDGALMLGIRCVSAAGPFSLTINASKAAITLVEVK